MEEEWSVEFWNVDGMGRHSKGDCIFSRCSYFIHLCDRLEISLLFSPALGTFHLSFFLSVFFLLVQSKVRRLPAQLLCQRPRTRHLFLVLPVGKVGEWDGGPWLYRVQNPMEDSLSEGSRWALFSASQGCAGCQGHDIRPSGLKCPWEGKDTVQGVRGCQCIQDTLAVKQWNLDVLRKAACGS